MLAWAVRVRNHLFGRPGFSEIDSLLWYKYNEEYKVGDKYSQPRWSPSSKFSHPLAKGYDGVVDPFGK